MRLLQQHCARTKFASQLRHHWVLKSEAVSPFPVRLLLLESGVCFSYTPVYHLVPTIDQ